MIYNDAACHNVQREVVIYFLIALKLTVDVQYCQEVAYRLAIDLRAASGKSRMIKLNYLEITTWIVDSHRS